MPILCIPIRCRRLCRCRWCSLKVYGKVTILCLLKWIVKQHIILILSDARKKRNKRFNKTRRFNFHFSSAVTTTYAQCTGWPMSTNACSRRLDSCDNTFPTICPFTRSIDIARKTHKHIGQRWSLNPCATLQIPNMALARIPHLTVSDSTTGGLQRLPSRVTALARVSFSSDAQYFACFARRHDQLNFLTTLWSMWCKPLAWNWKFPRILWRLGAFSYQCFHIRRLNDCKWHLSQA